MRPEHLKRQIDQARREAHLAAQSGGLAANILEAIIDRHLRSHAGELLRPDGIRFPLADGTDAEIVADIVGRYRSVGWHVEREQSDSSDALRFRFDS